MNDPEKVRYLEENLAALPDCASYTVSHAQGTLTGISYEIDANGNITAMSSGTKDPDGKIARENAQRRAKEKRAEEEKAAERRREKKAEKEKAAERQAERKKQAEVGEIGTFNGICHRYGCETRDANNCGGVWRITTHSEKF